MITACSELSWTRLLSKSVSSAPVSLHVHDHITDGSAFLFRGRRLGHFHIQLVFISSRIPRQQKENQKEQEHIDQRRELDPRVLERRVTTQIHERKMSTLRRVRRL